MAELLLRCASCGETTSPGPAKCPKCGGALARVTPAVPVADSGTGCALLAIGALILGGAGLMMSSPATLGAVIAAEGLLLAVLARVAQAGTHHKQLRAWILKGQPEP